MIHIIWGSNREKPQAARILADLLASQSQLTGQLYIGYPIVGSPNGPLKFDAILLSRELGLVAFDLVEGTDIGAFDERQDEIASMLDVKLKPYQKLKRGRDLAFEVNVVTFAPAKQLLPQAAQPYFIANDTNLIHVLSEFHWILTEDIFLALVAAIQVVTNIRAGSQKRTTTRDNSRGAKLKKLEESIANLDQHQSAAVIETVEGVQRIRGLAGSGKTIVLALKVAYLHAQNAEWRIAVTFNTRALNEQFRRLINYFCIEQTGSEPNWDNIDILNAWGGPGEKEQDGIYHRYCRINSIQFRDFGSAKATWTGDKAFDGACIEALQSAAAPIPDYDAILIDEAQDFPPIFLRLCYGFLREPKRLIYAYDELQSLTANSMPPPEELFGLKADGTPVVSFVNSDPTAPKQDIILEMCYRNSRPLLTTAHALGFGAYREQGLVQIFEQDELWNDVGYVLESGRLQGGEVVTLARTATSSPIFLEEHSSVDDLVQFVRFDSLKEQTDWLVNSIRNDIRQEELRPEDIVVINPDPLSTQTAVGPARKELFANGINSELAGVTTSRDIFSKSGCVTFTGIFRAKGNEAGMVYIINAQDCYASYSAANLALVRNRLFTAITRSKGWVRVLGIGPHMDGLIREFQALRNNQFKLVFKYPTEAEKSKLRLVNKDISAAERSKQRRLAKSGQEFIAAIARGELDPSILDQAVWDNFKKIIQDNGGKK